MKSTTIGPDADPKLLKKIIQDCEIMVRYATDAGLEVSPETLDVLGRASAAYSALETRMAALSTSDPHLRNEFLSLKKELDDSSETFRGLGEMHQKLSSIVHPATPRTIAATEPKRPKPFGWLRTDFSGRLAAVSLGTLCVFIVYSFGLIFMKKPGLIGDTNWDPIYAITGALLGACFYALFTANKYIVARTFDPAYEPVYYNRIILGVISGFILSLLFSSGKIAQLNVGPDGLNLSCSLIALLGGFSAEAVYKILSRLVAMLLALVQGEAKDVLDAKRAEWDTRTKERLIQQKYELVRKLNALYGLINATDDETLKKRFEEIVSDILK